jgi:hypothetical protein
MPTRFWALSRSTAALTVLLILVAPSHASFVPWSYNWTRSPIAVSSDSPGSGGISLTDEPLGHASGSSDVVATNLRTFSSATRSSPDHFTNAKYSLTLFLQDDNSGQHTTLTFTGVFNGTLTASNSNITTVFGPNSSQSVVLGGHTYNVALGSYAPPGPPSAVNAGSITAHVGVDEPPDSGGGGGGGGGGGTPPSGTPEPSTLLLSCLGLSCLAARAWRKRLA